MQAQMEKNYTALGMLAGAGLGTILAVLLFATTGEPLAFIVMGLLTGLGISAGAGMEQAMDEHDSR